MIRFWRPIRVTDLRSVPQLIVTYSRMVLSSPITSPLGCPLYFKSWGMAPTIAPAKIRQRAPTVVCPSRTACGPTVVPRPMRTCGPMTASGPTVTPPESSAPGSTSAVGWMAVPPLAGPSRSRRGAIAFHQGEHHARLRDHLALHKRARAHLDGLRAELEDLGFENQLIAWQDGPPEFDLVNGDEVRVLAQILPLVEHED